MQVLGDLTEDNFDRLMGAMTEWIAPEEGCAYCHGDGDVETYGEDALYTKVVARRMIQMTQNINENWSGHVNANKEVGVTCFTCHRGQHVPSEIWFNIVPVNEASAGWSANQNRATVLSQSTSLPSDALEKYLLGYETIGVHDYESRVANEPGDPLIQNAERTYSLMNYFSNSLGRNCVLCHNTRAFYDAEQVTPQWGTASLGIGMVQEMNNDYLVPLQDVYLTFIDTAGAYPGVEGEERSQSEAIAQNLAVMSKLRTPIIVVVTGEGGSGGALAIGVGDHVAIFEHAIYSVASPEACASIVWRSSENAPDAAEAMKVSAQELIKIGIVDEIIPEPSGGAHRDYEEMAMSLKKSITDALSRLDQQTIEEMLESRYQRLLRIGS